MSRILNCYVLGLVLFTGCATYNTLNIAEGYKKDTGEQVAPKPYFYAFMPFSIGFDVITSPVQALAWASVKSNEGNASTNKVEGR